MRFMTVFDFIRTVMAACKIVAEAHVVAVLRVAGMEGFWPLAQARTDRMVSEKMHAGFDPAQAMMRSVLDGGNLPDMAIAAMRPGGYKTEANLRRPSKTARGQG